MMVVPVYLLCAPEPVELELVEPELVVPELIEFIKALSGINGPTGMYW